MAEPEEQQAQSEEAKEQKGSEEPQSGEGNEAEASAEDEDGEEDEPSAEDSSEEDEEGPDEYEQVWLSSAWHRTDQQAARCRPVCIAAALAQCCMGALWDAVLLTGSS